MSLKYVSQLVDTQHDVRYSLIIFLSYLMTSCHQHHLYHSQQERDGWGNTAHHTLYYSPYMSTFCLLTQLSSQQHVWHSLGEGNNILCTDCHRGGFALSHLLISSSSSMRHDYVKWNSTKMTLVAILFYYRCFVSSHRPTIAYFMLISRDLSRYKDFI